mmetsp:Transcript_18885/g.37160  ORF Transcript_18885/g.37160 Transcript_18885/m.37160 type:complete len:142 (-) Transcript_18885:105-530(-)
MPIQVSSASLSPADLINKPLDVVQLLVDEAPADQITPNSDWGVPAFFQQKLAGTHIPLLNNSISADGSKILPTVGPQPQTLVRFRCMVQETLNSESSYLFSFSSFSSLFDFFLPVLFLSLSFSLSLFLFLFLFLCSCGCSS